MTWNYTIWITDVFPSSNINTKIRDRSDFKSHDFSAKTNLTGVCLQKQQDVRRSHYRAIIVPVLLRSRKAL
jgi:hypothetical protein